MNEKFTTEFPIEALAPAYVPEFFRLPGTAKGERDPYFGNSRSEYYQMAKLGEIKLVHLRRKGKTRGPVFVPFRQVLERIRAAAQEKGGAE